MLCKKTEIKKNLIIKQMILIHLVKDIYTWSTFTNQIREYHDILSPFASFAILRRSSNTSPFLPYRPFIRRRIWEVESSFALVNLITTLSLVSIFLLVFDLCKLSQLSARF